MKQLLIAILILSVSFASGQKVTQGYSTASTDSIVRLLRSEIGVVRSENVVLKNQQAQQQTVINSQAAFINQLQLTQAAQGTTQTQQAAILSKVTNAAFDSTDFVVTKIGDTTNVKLKNPIILK